MIGAEPTRLLHVMGHMAIPYMRVQATAASLAVEAGHSAQGAGREGPSSAVEAHARVSCMAEEWDCVEELSSAVVALKAQNEETRRGVGQSVSSVVEAGAPRGVASASSSVEPLSSTT